MSRRTSISTERWRFVISSLTLLLIAGLHLVTGVLWLTHNDWVDSTLLLHFAAGLLFPVSWIGSLTQSAIISSIAVLLISFFYAFLSIRVWQGSQFPAIAAFSLLLLDSLWLLLSAILGGRESSVLVPPFLAVRVVLLLLIAAPSDARSPFWIALLSLLSFFFLNVG